MLTRKLMIDIARSFNEYIPPPALSWDTPSPASDDGGNRPGDVFNRKATWDEVLVPHSWQYLGRTGNRGDWKRPGKTEPGLSATTGHCHSQAGEDLLYVFSSNAEPFEAGKTYSKFGAFAVLNHNGSFTEASKALAAKGYGELPQPMGRLIIPIPNGNGKHHEKANADNSTDPLDQDATALDLIEQNSTIRWAWNRWLPIGVLTILASEPGVGKTRFCVDLARRVANGLPWPDGTAPTFPKGSRTLWVPADNQHPELGSLPEEFKFSAGLLYLNTTKRHPFSGTMLDSLEDVKDFEARIARVRPALVFVDTCLNATDRSSHKPEDAKAFFVPLQQIAARQQCVLVCVTHLNAAGKPLGRRIQGQGRVVMQLESPDPDNHPNRRKLYVVKSNSIFPEPLGVTMGNEGNEYDGTPPERPPEESEGRGRQKKAPPMTCVWLLQQLMTGPKRVSDMRFLGEREGHSSRSLYAAVETLGINQYEEETYKWWELTPKKP